MRETQNILKSTKNKLTKAHQQIKELAIETLSDLSKNMDEFDKIQELERSIADAEYICENLLSG